MVWTNLKDIATLRNWRRQQIWRIIRQLFHFVDEGDQDWTVKDQESLFTRVKRNLDYVATQEMRLKRVIDRMKWCLPAFRYRRESSTANRRDSSRSPSRSVISQRQTPKAKRKVLKDCVALVEPFFAFQSRTWTLVPKIEDWRLKADTLGFD